MIENLKTLYRCFLREIAEVKYLSKFKDYEVLGENFIGNYYIMVFETNDMRFD